MRASSQCNSAELTSPVNMSYNYCSGNFSSSSCGGYLRYPGYSCGYSYHSNLVCSTDLCSPSTCQLGASLSIRVFRRPAGTPLAATCPVWSPAPARPPATAPESPYSAVPASRLTLDR
ncbi:keratin-associated protein 13-1-like [Chlorocebus sabaeus]|uniref:keratin-associated protein 13-1-like n=1 Tax=Chlorocebus sabaeus TaxID=60711 RepID=UPI0031CC4B51